MLQKHLTAICLALALLFLAIASFLYPGGSQADSHSTGYDWTNNYLCNLFDAKGMNGAANPGMIWAFIGMFFMCLGCGIFFYRVSTKIRHRSSSMIIRYAGMAAMFFAFWVITPYHNIMVTIAVTFAMIAIFYLSVFVFMSRSVIFKLLTLLCLISLYFTAFLYYSSTWLEILPITQKLNFLIILVWILGLEYFTTSDDFPVKTKKTKS